MKDRRIGNALHLLTRCRAAFRTDETHDLAATKLRRFWPKDREDIRLLCDLGILEEQRLEATLEKAFPFNLPKDGDSFRDGAFEHLRVVQRYLRGEIGEF